LSRVVLLFAIAVAAITAWVFLDPPAPREAWAYFTLPPAAKTGGPGEGLCTECHSGSVVNEAGGSVSIKGAPASYLPNQTYDLMVTVRHTTQRRWGFELVPFKSNNTMAGVLTSTVASTKTQVLNGKTYISHTDQNGVDGTFLGQLDSATWAFSWTAPSATSGTVTFYAAGNAANGTGTNAGDKIYTTSASVTEGSMTDVDATTWGKIKMLYR
jgi:hypothetical protein